MRLLGVVVLSAVDLACSSEPLLEPAVAPVQAVVEPGVEPDASDCRGHAQSQMVAPTGSGYRAWTAGDLLHEQIE